MAHILINERCNLFSLLLFLALSFLSNSPLISSLSTIAISETSNQTLICALIRSQDRQSTHLNCTSFPAGIQIPTTSQNGTFSGIVAGEGFLCFQSSSLSSSSAVMSCWRFSTNGTNMSYKRIYLGPPINELESGNSRICGLVDSTNRLECWQWYGFNSTAAAGQNFTSIAVGGDFVCGLMGTGNITCLGRNSTDVVPQPSSNTGNSYIAVAAGFRHACAIFINGGLDCWGEMMGEKPAGEFTSLALGENRSCGLRSNQTVVCWGENNFSLPESLRATHFATIEAKRSVFCGVVASNYSLFCWGNEIFDSNFMVFENNVLPGACSIISCPCGQLSDSGSLCDQGYICQPCEGGLGKTQPPPPSPASSPPPESSNSGGSSRWNTKMVAFMVVGCVGSLSFVLACSFFLIFRYCKGGEGSRVHDSGRLENDPEAGEAQSGQPVLQKRLSHLYSIDNGGHLEEFSLQVLLEATNNFSEDHKVGTGSFGTVYHATLDDNGNGREVAIKRAETSTSMATYGIGGGTKRGQEEDKDNAFLNELQFLSRLNHKNLVRLLGFYEDINERVLVYEYMPNGSLHDHLHQNVQNSPLMSWEARLKVALDAARGIEYLHSYAVPTIIHRDIKSSNILLDETWSAKVSDFGLSLMGPEDKESHLSLRAAGTMGYMDPEYYRLQQLTTKSDVYSFGVMLLELLSGYRAIHRNENGVPRNVVDFVVPYIVQDEIHRVLDPKVPPPTPIEIEAVAYIGYLAADCVTREGRDRPSMTEIVNSLDSALSACLVPVISFSRSSTESST